MIHPWQSDLTLVSKAELQQEEENHPDLSCHFDDRIE